MRTLATAILTSLALAWGAAAWGQAALSGGQIEGFMAAMTELQPLGEKYKNQGEPWRATSGPQGMNRSLTPFATALPRMQAHAAYDEIVAVVTAHGFADIAQFAEIADRIVLTYVAIKTADQASQQKAQMENSIRQIEASEMAPAQKKNMIDMMRESLEMMAAYQSAPEADRAALRPYMPQLESSFK